MQFHLALPFMVHGAKFRRRLWTDISSVEVVNAENGFAFRYVLCDGSFFDDDKMRIFDIMADDWESEVES